MPTFHQRVTKKISDFDVFVYEVDNSNADEVLKLESYLTSKIKNIRIYNELDRYTDLLNVPNVDPAFAAKLKESIKEICDPKKHSIAAFDIRRSFVTEFLSQLLLEKNYNCVF